MKLRPLLELNSELRSLGYSRTFVRTFVEELHDHFGCLVEEQGWQDCGQVILEQRFVESLGSQQELVRAVTVRPELDPWPRKYPVLFYLWIPGILTLLMTMGLVHLLFLIRDNIEAVPLNLVSFVDWLAFFVPALIPTLGAVLAIRYRVPVFFPLVLATMTAFSTLFVADVEWCGQTASPFIYSLWRFEPIRFALPLLATALVFLVARFLIRIPMTRGQLAPGSLPLAMCMVALVVLGFAFHRGLNETTANYRKHPVDNMVEVLASPERRQYRVITVMSKPEVRDELDLSAQQLSCINQTLDHFETTGRQLAPVVAPNGFAQSSAEYDALITTTSERLLCELGDQQLRRLNQLTWQLMGWRALFLPEVRKGIDLSEYQFHLFKNVHLEAIHEETRLNREWYHGDDARRKQTAREFKVVVARLNQAYEDVLTERQVSRLNELKGSLLKSSKRPDSSLAGR